MPRLIALISLAACLIFALVAIVSAEGCYGRCSGSIEGIRQIDPTKRSDKQWEELAKNAIETFHDTKRANKLSFAEVEKLLSELKEAVEHNENLKSKVPESWLKLMKLRERSLLCNIEDLSTFYKFVVKKRGKGWQFNYALDCLRERLQECPYEEYYQKAIGKLRREKWDLVKYPTLASYLAGEFLVGWSKIGSIGLKRELNWAMFFFSAFTKADSVNFAEDCDNENHRNKFGNALDHSKAYYPELHKVIKEHFGVYLVKCGYEEKFKASLIDHHVETNVESDSPLADYLWGDFTKTFEANGGQDYRGEIVFAIQVVRNLWDPLTMEEYISCKPAHTDIFVLMRNWAKEKKHTKLLACLDGTFADYLKACTNDFKAKAKKIEDNSNKAFASLKKFAEEIETEVRTNYKDDDRSSRQIIDEILTEDRLEDLKYICGSVKNVLERYLGGISLDFCLASQEEETKAYMNLIGYCYTKKVNQNIDEAVLYMFDKLGAPYYPTKAAEPVIQAEECRRYE